MRRSEPSGSYSPSSVPPGAAASSRQRRTSVGVVTSESKTSTSMSLSTRRVRTASSGDAVSRWRASARARIFSPQGGIRAAHLQPGVRTERGSPECRGHHARAGARSHSHDRGDFHDGLPIHRLPVLRVTYGRNGPQDSKECRPRPVNARSGAGLGGSRGHPGVSWISRGLGALSIMVLISN